MRLLLAEALAGNASNVPVFELVIAAVVSVAAVSATLALCCEEGIAGARSRFPSFRRSSSDVGIHNTTGDTELTSAWNIRLKYPRRFHVLHDHASWSSVDRRRVCPQESLTACLFKLKFPVAFGILLKIVTNSHQCCVCKVCHKRIQYLKAQEAPENKTEMWRQIVTIMSVIVGEGLRRESKHREAHAADGGWPAGY
jgi:hypothetical protein